MNNLNTQNKEQLIVTTILDCNNQISKLYEGFKTPNLRNLMERNNMYYFNMLNLMGDINKPLMENFVVDQNNPAYVRNTRGNYYSYFQKVHKFLDGFEPNIVHTLNESLSIIPENLSIKNPIQLNIMTFKHDLKNIIDELEKRNDLDSSLSLEILKIKTFAKKPLFIYGFDICNNIALRKELFEKFNVTDKNLIAICFDKSEKRLLFIPDIADKIICYDLKSDTLDYYNNLVGKIIDDSVYSKLSATKIEARQYLSKIKELIHNNMFEVYANSELFNFTFTDNLFSDKIRNAINNEINEASSSIIRK